MEHIINFINSIGGNVFGLVSSSIFFILGLIIGRTSNSKYEVSVIKDVLDNNIEIFRINNLEVKKNLIKKNNSYLKELNLNIEVMDVLGLMYPRMENI